MVFDASLRYFGLQKPIFARSGWEIPQPDPLSLEDYQQSEDLIRIRTVALVDELLRKGMTNVKIRSVSSHLYDCVGMVFCNRRAWIDIYHVYDILREDGYTRIPIEQVVVGDIVVYTRFNNPQHVGLTTQVHPNLGQIPLFRVLSKWGSLGEIEHNLEDVPEMFGVPDSYWSERIR